MRLISALIGCSLLLGMAACTQTSTSQDYTDFVNPFIGTGGHGHTYPGAVVPNGMIQPSPDTRIYQWDACSGYYYNDSTINGFSHTHLSGTGCGDYGDVLLMPTVGKQDYQAMGSKSQQMAYASAFSHQNEMAQPGYYSVVLDRYNVKAELTATKRAAIHRYTFPQSDESGFILDLDYSLQRQKNEEMELEVISDTEICGRKKTVYWAFDQYINFYAKFSKPFTYTMVTDSMVLDEGEVKYAHQNVGFEAIDPAAGKFLVKNRFYFTNLKKYMISYTVKANGKTIKGGKVSLDIEPQGSKELNINLNGLKPKAGTEYFVDFVVTTTEPEPLIPAGHDIASEQFRLPIEPLAMTGHKASGKTTVSTDGDVITVLSPRMQFVFNKKSGLVTSYKVNGTEYFAEGFGIQPNFWRAPTDNDYGNGGPKREQIWKQSSKNFNVADVTTTTDGNKTVLTVNYLLAAGNLYIMKYTIYPDGVVHAGITFTSTDMKAADTEVSEATLMATFTPGQDAQRLASSKLNVPRIGVRFHLPSDMNQVEYFGRGPGENYIDRNASSFVDLYRTTADQMYTNNYVRPQENGHRTDTRWVELTRKGGKGLLIRADSTIGFNALRNSVEDFDSEEAISRPRQWTNFTPEEVANHNEEKAKNVIRRMTHVNDITPRNFVEVCIDMKQQGVAGYDSWGDRPLPEHTLPANKEYHWGFTLMPVK